ncbi:hypothetical protein [Priestia megaterium]|uniref:hypothetical protein n=1 Tax=Priestia megaterium TaxID=1404 RepID=UPI0023DA3B3B|nr:hypothetical protein [Priestia megaterium]MDF2010233.1 hypothetical protein [Priestia megaterium]
MGKSLYKTDENEETKGDNVSKFPKTHTPNSRYVKGGNGKGEPTTEEKEGEQTHVVDAVHSNVNEPSISDILNSISKREPEEKKPKQVSIYLEPDIQEMFIKYGKLEGKGKRSELVNKLLKPALTKYFIELQKENH